MRTILVTAGPIPSRLDSVKYLTNRFKGGLALETAQRLHELGNKVTVMKWRHHPSLTDLPTIDVEDVYDYYAKVLSFEADAYVLAAAVANLGPAEVINGKFPSHKYKVGDTFDIPFTIMPRVIDEIKKARPRSALIGYKLFDGTHQELMEAAWHTLTESKANLVFANFPHTAKTEKYVLTQDGGEWKCTFDEHVEVIHQLANETYYRTSLISRDLLPELHSMCTPEEISYMVENYPRTLHRGRTFGTFAMRARGNSFITTSRGKKTKEIVYVQDVNHRTCQVFADGKATLNAPLLHRLFETYRDVNFVLHDHKFLTNVEYAHRYYQFPGTKGDSNVCLDYLAEGVRAINLPHHGYIAALNRWSDVVDFIDTYKV